MFGFFKGISFRADCTKVITGILPTMDPQQGTEFTEDFKSLFDKSRESNLDPKRAVIHVCNLVLLAIARGDENSLKNFDNCILTVPITMAVVKSSLHLNQDENIKKELQDALKTVEERENKLINELEKVFPEQMSRLKD